MRRALALALVAACSAPAAPPRPATPPTRTTSDAPLPSPANAVVGFAARTRKIESRHGGEITALAVTPEGSAALSIDELGGARLWPTLDGTLEPRVVDLSAARSLALGVDPRGFIAAAIDTAGGMTIAILDRDGLILQRASLPAEPAFERVAMTTRGVIATRSDHSIVRIDAAGAIVERIVAADGERLAGFAARGDTLVVQVEDTRRRLRFVTVAPALQWGGWIPSKVPPEGVFAVSPRGTSLALAVGQPPERTLVIIDAATGAVRGGEPVGGAPFDIAYADEDHVVIAARGGARVHAIDRRTPSTILVPAAGPTQRDASSAAGGGERVVAPASAELVLVDRAKKAYLGYEIESPTVVAAAPEGGLMIGVGATFARLDKELATIATPDLALPAVASVAELQHVDGERWIVEWANLENGRTSTAFVDLATNARDVLRADRESVHALAYDARSRLATFGLGDAAEIRRFDPRKRTLASVAVIKPEKYRQTALAPLAPALAGGNELVVVTIGDRLTLRWVPDARLPDKGKSLQLDGTFAAADPTGAVYVWTRDGGTFSTRILRDAKVIATLAAERPVAISPDPAGGRYVEVAQNEVSLVAHDGSRAWTLAVPGVNEVHWLSDGALALVGSGGLARVDPATGGVQAARCGWRFGLSTTQHRSSSRVEPLCTQLR